MKLLATLLLPLAACGGGDDGHGLDTEARLTSLTAEQRADLCEWSLDEQGGAGETVECGAQDVTLVTVAQCTATLAGLGDDCDATVADAEACAEADVCAPGAACAAITACID
jgi:hypothetical protein